jgi:hypothetical protein
MDQPVKHPLIIAYISMIQIHQNVIPVKLDLLSLQIIHNVEFFMVVNF